MLDLSSNFIFFLIYFFYGLAFFSLGMAISIERKRCSDDRLRFALGPLAAFGFIHGLHEWMDMFEYAGMVLKEGDMAFIWLTIKLVLLAFSFLLLAGFGFPLLAPTNTSFRRSALLAFLLLVVVWGFGLFFFTDRFNIINYSVIDVWTRYAIAIPAATIAAAGLIVQRRVFRQAGMAQFGRDALIASVAFACYGFVGQTFTRPSSLWPSTFFNRDLFIHWFGFPPQLFRAAMAILMTIAVIRFMQSFYTETQRQIENLQEARVKEARQREVLRGELFKRVISVQESERQRIARELHDETGQTITAIGLGLRGVAAELDKDKDKAKANLRKLEVLASDLLEELERLIANLRPAHLDDLGLASAIRWYISKVKAHVDFKFNFRMFGNEILLPDSLSIAIYRMAQEAITNVIKHANANEIHIELHYGNDQIRLSVSDDGQGMETEAISRKDSWGILGMKERTHLLGGEFIIESAPGEGVKIVVIIPYVAKGTELNLV